MAVSGTVTFLFTDIEDSTGLWEAQPARMAAVLARHDALCRDVVGERGGRVVKTTGDGLYATFDNPVERHSHIKPHASWQPLPGLDAELDPKADHGETSYRGTGRLPGRKARSTLYV